MAAFNQRLLPVLIDAAGGVEGRLEFVAIGMRRSPATCLMAAAGVGFVLGSMVVTVQSRSS